VARVSGHRADDAYSRAPLTPAYFRRIEAMEPRSSTTTEWGGLDEADIVLVGVSRTSKTRCRSTSLPGTGCERPDRVDRVTQELFEPTRRRSSA
jgi:hypothetical protein